jgi:hypothetical protein
MLLHLEKALEHPHRVVLHAPHEQPLGLVGPELRPMVTEVGEAPLDGIQVHMLRFLP